jgi:hypothetical protein
VQKDILDLPNWDLIVRDYAIDLGMAPNKLNTAQVVDGIRKARAQQAAQQAAQEASLAAVQGAQVASKTDMGGDTALTRLLNTTGGGGGPV